MTDRSEYIKGLRKLADVLEAHPEIPLPIDSGMHIMFLSGADPKAEIAAAAKAFPCTLTKDVWSASADYFSLHGQIAGVKIQLTAYRDAVCERVVTGTREVPITEPDPEALAKVPTVTRVQTVEDVEWVCHPVLAPSAGELVAAKAVPGE